MCSRARLRSQRRQRIKKPLWSPAIATGGNRSQVGERGQRLRQAKTVAVGCDPSPESFHGKECHEEGPPRWQPPGCPPRATERRPVFMLHVGLDLSRTDALVSWPALRARKARTGAGSVRGPALPAAIMRVSLAAMTGVRVQADRPLAPADSWRGAQHAASRRGGACASSGSRRTRTG
jgi:hypothetical protein